MTKQEKTNKGKEKEELKNGNEIQGNEKYLGHDNKNEIRENEKEESEEGNEIQEKEKDEFEFENEIQEKEKEGSSEDGNQIQETEEEYNFNPFAHRFAM
jgi:hypothetical protein